VLVLVLVLDLDLDRFKVPLRVSWNVEAFHEPYA
jgi:hypothetical protein